MADDKFMKLFQAIKQKHKQNGGSFASDSVNAQVPLAAFERINFLLGGGGIPSMSLPIPDANAYPNTLSSSMVTSLAQPLAPNISFNNDMTFPNDMARFSPFLTNN